MSPRPLQFEFAAEEAESRRGGGPTGRTVADSESETDRRRRVPSGLLAGRRPGPGVDRHKPGRIAGRALPKFIESGDVQGGQSYGKADCIRHWQEPCNLPVGDLNMTLNLNPNLSNCGILLS